MKRVFCVSLVLILGLLTACGGPRGKIVPVAYFSPSRLEKMALTVVQLEGTLKTARGEAVHGVRVTTSSQRYAENSLTANDGHFSLVAKYAQGDALDFHFSGNGVEGTETVNQLPGGVDKITLRFEADKYGQVRLAAIEY